MHIIYYVINAITKTNKRGSDERGKQTVKRHLHKDRRERATKRHLLEEKS